MAISKTAVKTLRELYLGETIVIHLKNMNLIIPDGEGNSLGVSPMIEDTVLEIDQDYMHLGTIDNGVTKSLPHDSIGLIEVSLGQMQEMMDMSVEGEAH